MRWRFANFHPLPSRVKLNLPFWLSVRRYAPRVISLCLPVFGSRSHTRASSCPKRPLVTTAPVITGCPISVTPGEVARTVALLFESGFCGVQSAPGAAAPLTAAARVLLPPFDVIFNLPDGPR
jgi:hypothetical protein